MSSRLLFSEHFMDNDLIERGRGARWAYLDVCRVLAIFSVVLIHVTATQWHVDAIGSRDWIVLTAYFGGTRFFIPIFFMVTGALMLNPDKPVTIKALYGKYILRFVTALLFWSFLYHAVAVNAWNPYFRWEDFDARAFIGQVLGGHPYQHWFLFAIISMYLLIPLLKCITRSESATRYFIVLWLAWEIGLYNVRLLGGAFPDMNPAVSGMLGEIAGILDRVLPRMVLGLHGYMVLGYYLHTHPPGTGGRRLLQILGVIGTVFTVAATVAVSVRDGIRTEMFLDLNALPVCVPAAATFVTAQVLFPGRRAGTSGAGRFFVAMSEYSFGVYLVHDFFLIYLRDKGFTPAILSRGISPLVVALAVYVLSVCVVRLIRKIPGARDYVT